MAGRLPMRWFQEHGVLPDQVDCTKCPHPWAAHEIEIGEDLEAQQGGWIECPACDCRVFWYADDIIQGRG